MSRLTDPADLQARLEQDRVWSAFSLADLDEPYAAHARWFGAPDSHALVLVYGAFSPPIVYLQGTAAECERILSAPVVLEQTMSAWLNVLPGHDAAVRSQFTSFAARAMVRMVLRPGRLLAVACEGLVRLGPDDLSELESLYADERPAFFMPSQLTDGVYFGVREGGRLVSVAGTHVVSERGRVGALGNVYTRPECRGRRLAAAATSAVATALFARQISTVVLNIVSTNDPARRVYERLGFEAYCVYHEGEARR